MRTLAVAIRSPRPLCRGITDSHDQSADWSRNDTQILSASVIARAQGARGNPFPRPYAFISSSHAKKRWPGGHLFDCRKTRRVFPTKGLRSAARIICPSVTDKFHTGSPSCIFSHAHVARENDFISLPPAGGKLCEAFLIRCTGPVYTGSVMTNAIEKQNAAWNEPRPIC